MLKKSKLLITYCVILHNMGQLKMCIAQTYSVPLVLKSLSTAKLLVHLSSEKCC